MATIGTDIHLAAKHLKEGNLIGLPTETVYGLAGNAFNQEAVLNIFKVKNRPTFDPLIIHVSSIEKAAQLVEHIPDKAKKLMEKVWPGPLTVLLKKNELISDLVTSGSTLVGIRIPNHPLSLDLLKNIDFPLAAPSANPFGYISPTNAIHVNDQLGEKIPYILNGGECPVGIESTIVEFYNDQIFVHRLGGLSLEELENICGKVILNLNVSGNPLSPGQLKSHYAPRTPVILFHNPDEIDSNENNAGILNFNRYVEGINFENQLILSKEGNTDEAARNLFAFMRLLDQKGYKKIFAQLVPEKGLGRAINDRLKRAAAKD